LSQPAGAPAPLAQRGGKTLAWLGDAAFERAVRLAICARGDFRSARLDRIKARIVRADAQAALLAALEPALEPEELTVVSRGRNATPSGRPKAAIRDVRAATALEALIGWWDVTGRWARFEALVAPAIAAAIDDAIAGTHGHGP
jgi:ribonuclease-3 family protein